MDLSRYVVLDCTTGTFFNAVHAVLIDCDQLSTAELQSLEDGSDLDRVDLAESVGQDLEQWSSPNAMSQSEQLLQALADALWGDGADTEWCPDTVQAIADAIQAERPDLVTARI